MFGHLRTNDLLSEKNTVAIIVYLYIFGPTNRTTIYKNVSTNPRMPIKIDRLMESGLVKPVNGNSSSYTVLELTQKGKKFGEMLCTMERIAGGDLELYKWQGIKTTLDEFMLVTEDENPIFWTHS